ITASMGLGRAVRSLLLESPDLTEDPLIGGLHVKISGCPNGCGQHHLADIGFHGATVKGQAGLQVPAYDIFVGGRYEGGDVRYGTRLRGKVPAKAVPQVLRAFLIFYRDHRQPGEPFHAFVDRRGRESFERIAAPFGEVLPFDPQSSLSRDFYEDWERTGLYRLERGEGECSA
ncbi:MAG: nitrite/sulfite reductase, partial [Armatimonadetes bacterium]|nr:nitrite/sulfite reductase [Armatimonadota bacterium]